VVWSTTMSKENLSTAVFDPTNRYLALVDNDKGFRLLELATLKEIKAFDLPKDATLWNPQFSPDGKRFSVVAQDLTNSNHRSLDPNNFEQGEVWLADVTRPNQPERVVLPPNAASQSIWTPDGKSLVVRALGVLYVIDATKIRPATQ
jgi:dipeptidyl aminopeptidase/acylaminoacyl peptidase